MLVDYTLPSVLNSNALFYCEWARPRWQNSGSVAWPAEAPGRSRWSSEDSLSRAGSSSGLVPCQQALSHCCVTAAATTQLAAAGANNLPFVMGTTGGDRDKLLADVSCWLWHLLICSSPGLGCSSRQRPKQATCGRELLRQHPQQFQQPLPLHSAAQVQRRCWAQQPVSLFFGERSTQAASCLPVQRFSTIGPLAAFSIAGQGQRQLRGDRAQHGQADCGLPGARGRGARAHLFACPLFSTRQLACPASPALHRPMLLQAERG